MFDQPIEWAVFDDTCTGWSVRHLVRRLEPSCTRFRESSTDQPPQQRPRVQPLESRAWVQHVLELFQHTPILKLAIASLLAFDDVDGDCHAYRKIQLTKEQEGETYLPTLYGKALDNRAKHPILNDTFAHAVVQRIDFDFAKKFKWSHTFEVKEMEDVLGTASAKKLCRWTTMLRQRR